MTFEADLRAHLSDASITQYVSADRIEPAVRPRAQALPAITYLRIAGVPQTDMDGDDGNLMNIRVQLDVWSKRHDPAKLIAEAIRLRMQTAAATFRSVMLLDQDFYEDDVEIFRVSMDFSCWYRTT